MKNNNVHITANNFKKEFELFIQNKMTEKEKLEFIANNKNDEFVNEAIKGYNLLPDAIIDLNEIDKSLKISIKSTGTGFKNIFVLSTALITVSIIIIYFILTTHNNSEKIINQKSQHPISEVDTHKINILNYEIKSADELPEIEQITINQAKTDQKLIRDFEKLIPLEKINNSKVTAKNENINDSLNNNLAFINMSTTYMYEFKVVDYSKIYNNSIKIDIFENNGLSAKFENYQNINNQNYYSKENNYITYNQFLSETMEMLSKNNYKNALQNFIIVLQQFPNDQNAHFYGGLCYYNLGLYQKSIEHFDAVIDSKVNVFYQEAQWYKSLSLINLGYNDKAQILLKKIIKENGFYYKRANDKLLQIVK